MPEENCSIAANDCPAQPHTPLSSPLAPTLGPETSESHPIIWRRSVTISVTDGVLSSPPSSSDTMSSSPTPAQRIHYRNEEPVVESVRLSKREVSAIIGPGARRIKLICFTTQCQIVLLPVTFDTVNLRHRTQDLPQAIQITGKRAQVQQAKLMLRRALLEYRSK